MSFHPAYHPRKGPQHHIAHTTLIYPRRLKQGHQTSCSESACPSLWLPVFCGSHGHILSPLSPVLPLSSFCLCSLRALFICLHPCLLFIFAVYVFILPGSVLGSPLTPTCFQGSVFHSYPHLRTSPLTSSFCQCQMAEVHAFSGYLMSTYCVLQELC